jgi:4-hydroxy-tetrahydrodipicolinate synthase
MIKNCKEVRGTVIPLPTAFTKDGEVDYKTMHSYVEFLIANGIKNVMTTVGTSRFNLLTDDEVFKLNETVVNAAAGKAVTIVANPTVGSVKRTIEFGKHAQKIGADFFLAYYPERHYGEENIYNYFHAITKEVSTPILLHEMPMRNGFGPGQIQYSIQLLEKLIQLPTIAGFKEEALDNEHSNKIVSTFKDKAVIIGAGGGMSRYLLRDYDLGSKAFLGGIGNFFPSLEIDFFKAITGGEKLKAEKIVNEIELPYFQKVVPFGWHPSLKAALALKGLMQPFERAPMIEIKGEQLEQLKTVMQNNGWL